MANRRRASGSTRLRAHFPNEMERPTIPLPPIPSEEEEKSTKDVFKGNDPPYSPTPTNQTPPMPEVQPNELDAGTTERVAIVSPVSVSTGGEAMKEHKDIPTNPAVLEARKASFASSTESAIGSILHSLTDDPIFSMNPDDYKIGPAIGFGSSAIVYHTTYLPLNMTVAVKMMDLDHFERNQIDELRKEIQVMTLCKHSNLLKIYASFVHDSKLWIVTPYLSGGSCLDIMKTGFRDGLEESVIATILQQALLGLEYLHRNGHIHRDVKAGNLLMDSDGTVQLADFGVSSSLMEDIERKGIRKTFVGTPCWMAPEVMEMSRGYDVKADIWSFGITALELAYGHAPFAKYPPMKVIYLTLSSAPPTLERKRCRNKYSKTFKEMIDQCLQRDPSKRPTADHLLKHAFFKNAKKKSFLVNMVLNNVPPLVQRPRVTKLIKQLSGCPDNQREEATAWDFATDEATESETDYIGTDASTAPNSPIPREQEEDAINNAGNMDKKSSRFVIETDNLTEIGSPNLAPEEVKKISPVEVLNLEPMAEEDETGIKKGRFSVLESASTTRQDRSFPTSHESSPPPKQSEQTELAFSAQTIAAEIEQEDGRRSRFQVEPHLAPNTEGMIYANNAGSERPRSRQSPSNEATQSRFYVSNPGKFDSQTASVDSLPAPHPRGIGFSNSMLYQESEIEDEAKMGLNDAFVHPTAARYAPQRSYAGYNHPQHGHQSQSSLIFVHPSQFDQLLLLNELMRQQILELRNSATSRRLEQVYGTGTGSHLSTFHTGDESSFYADYFSPGLGFRDPTMAEDPQIVHPPQLSHYVPVQTHNPSHLSLSHPMEPSVPTRSFSKRRSFSIDNRHFSSTNNPASHHPTLSNLRHGAPSINPLGGVQHHPGSVMTHRSVQSMKSPINPSFINERLSSMSMDTMRKELEQLRKDNEMLRKK